MVCFGRSLAIKSFAFSKNVNSSNKKKIDPQLVISHFNDRECSLFRGRKELLSFPLIRVNHNKITVREIKNGQLSQWFNICIHCKGGIMEATLSKPQREPAFLILPLAGYMITISQFNFSTWNKQGSIE